MSYYRLRIKDNIEISSDLYNLILEGDYPPFTPGQFHMLWIPDKEEIPMAPSIWRGYMRITYKVVGDTTKHLSSLSQDEYIYVRGPLGRGFKLDKPGRYLLLGGGVGAAPIIYAAKVLADKGYEFTYVEGVRTSSHKMFIEEAKDYGGESILYTEDGSQGYKGYPTDYLERYGDEYDFILACGPEEMNRKVVKICYEKGINCQVSMERIVKCGLGVCGSCVVEGTGLLVCLDGPVFEADELVKSGYVIQPI